MRQRIVHVCFVPLSNIGLPLIETKKDPGAGRREERRLGFGIAAQPTSMLVARSQEIIATG